MKSISIGISTCPNDTFAFHALMNRKVAVPNVELNFELLDIEQLNEGVWMGRFDVAKASFHLAMHVEKEYQVLNAGAALGFGVGPLLLASRPGTAPRSGERSTQTTLCPGQYTTANLLFSLFFPQATKVEQVVFSEIMPRLVAKTADFGVCIHEGRFTWHDQGLSLVEDLGSRWEKETALPLPLGGIVARRFLDPVLVNAIENAIRESIEYSRRHPHEALATMRRYAQELEDHFLWQHVDLYVNDWTLNLGVEGQKALPELRLRFQKVTIE